LKEEQKQTLWRFDKISKISKEKQQQQQESLASRPLDVAVHPGEGDVLLD